MVRIAEPFFLRFPAPPLVILYFIVIIMDTIFQTSRLLFRRFVNNEEDAALILSMNSQPEVLKYLHEPLLQNISDAKDMLTNHILPQYENNLGRWAVFLKDGGQFIGWCGLKFRVERNETDLGYRFIPTAWGKGYGAEAAKACLQFGFSRLGLQVINACAHIENTASLSILQKIGMQYTHDDRIDDCPVRCFVALKQDHSGTDAFS